MEHGINITTAELLTTWEKDGPPPIFINYRSSDIYAAALLDTLLSGHFGAERIFRAGRSIPAGADFSDILEAASAGAKVLVPIIGIAWAASLRGGNDGWVVREIRAAQDNGVKILPVLLDGVTRLRGANLPSGIDMVADIVPARLEPRRPVEDVARIASAICSLAPGLRPFQPTPHPV